MNTISKTLFWIFTITLGFVNPLISFGLIVLYYLPGIIQSACNPCNEECTENNQSTDYTTEEFITFEENGKKYTVRKDQVPPKMDSFSEDTLEDMK
jgi:hypothetical protein